MLEQAKICVIYFIFKEVQIFIPVEITVANTTSKSYHLGNFCVDLMTGNQLGKQSSTFEAEKSTDYLNYLSNHNKMQQYFLVSIT